MRINGDVCTKKLCKLGGLHIFVALFIITCSYEKMLCCVIIFLQAGLLRGAQTTKSTEHVNQLWFGYFNQTRFSNKWGMWTDLHLRTKEDFVNNFSQSIVRLGLTYYVTDATKFTAGFAYVSHLSGGCT